MKHVEPGEATEWKHAYEQDGKSIEQISLDTGRSTDTISRWLHLLDTQMRPAVPRAKPASPNLKPTPPIHHVAGRDRRGHRRRSMF